MIAGYHLVQTKEQLEACIADCESVDTFACDLETKSLTSFHRNGIVGISFSPRKGVAYYVPMRHLVGDQLEPEYVIKRVKPLLESGRTVCFHNVKFDTRFLRAVGIHIDPKKLICTMLAAYTAGTPFEEFGLKELIYYIFKHKMIEFEDLFGPKDRTKDFATLPIDNRTTEYGCQDSDWCLRLWEWAQPRVKGNFIFLLEQSLWPVVQRIEDTGITADRAFLKGTQAYLLAEAAKVERIIHDQVNTLLKADVQFSIGSSKQLSDVLYNMLKFPVYVKTPKGAPSTNDVALERLADDYPVARNIQTYKSMVSTANTLGDTVFDCIWEGDDAIWGRGRVHTNYQQTGAITGRFSSSHPNLQNLAKEKKWTVILPDGSAYEVRIIPRNAFKAAPGFYLVEVDFSAIEFVVMAAACGDSSMVKFYADGGDVHVKTYSEVMGVPVDQVTEESRGLGKTWNYAIAYGTTGYGLSLRTGKSQEDSDSDLALVFQKRPLLAKFISDTHTRARVAKFVTTMFGRRVVVRYYLRPGRGMLGKGDRLAVNGRIQGSAADIHKIALHETDCNMAKVYPRERAHCALQTHDSQAWEVEDSIPPDEFIPQLIEHMSRKLHPQLPRIRVDAKIGIAYGDLVKYKEGMDYKSVLDEHREKHKTAEFVAPPPAAKKAAPKQTPSRLIIELGGNVPTPQQIQLFREVLETSPGDHAVAVVLNGRVQDLPLATHYNAKELRDMLAPVFPECVVRADIKSMAESVMVAA